jgi:hypothetical protein
MITASILYNLVECSQRVALDAFGDVARRDEINPFVRLLWERGTLFEQETISKLQIPFVDLSGTNEVDRDRLTLDAMSNGEPLIYGGCIRAGDLALLWQIVGLPRFLGFPNRFFNDSWMVGSRRADHGELGRRTRTLAQAISGSIGS